MRIRLLLASSSVVVACIAPEGGSGWSGDWEGFVETTNQSVFTNLELTEADSTWTGQLRLPGAPPIAVAPDTRGDTISFDIELGPQQIAFTGVRDSDSVVGDAAVVDGPVFPFSLRRLPSVTEPRSRVDAWRQDLDHVERRFLAYDRSYSDDTRAEAVRRLEQLRGELGQLSDPEIVVRLSQIAALADNAHTRMYLLRNRLALRRYPVRMWWFRDGLYVVRASPEYANMLRCRVTTIAGVDVQSLRDQVGELFAGNESWVNYKSPYFMASPEILQGLGVLDTDAARFAVECNGGIQEIEITPDTLIALTRPTENWWSLSPLHVDSTFQTVSAFDTTAVGVPLYLQQPSQHYWMIYLAELDVLYLQYNRSQNMSDGPSFSDFAESVFAEIDGRDIRAVAVDLRFNTGGNQGTARAFFEELASHPKVADRLFVITGPATFSAGLYHAGQLAEGGRARLVGQHPGDHLDSWSEGGNIVLPHSGYTMHFANGFHSGSTAEPPSGVRLMSDLSVESLEPGVPVQMSFVEYVRGEDLALHEALRRVER